MSSIPKNSPPTQRTLTLRGVVPKAIRRPAPAAKPAAPALPDVPADALLSFVNWRVGFRRPTRRYLSRETALGEAQRLRAENPGAVIHTYALALISEDAP